MIFACRSVTTGPIGSGKMAGSGKGSACCSLDNVQPCCPATVYPIPEMMLLLDVAARKHGQSVGNSNSQRPGNSGERKCVSAVVGKERKHERHRRDGYTEL